MSLALAFAMVSAGAGGWDSVESPAPAPSDVAAPPPDALTTPSGVAMRVLKAGRGGRSPLDNDCVSVQFTAWRRDGALLGGTRLRGGAEVQCLRAASPGVAEALKTMVVGEERRVWVPARLTYRAQAGADEPPSVPPVDVTIDLELVDLMPAPPTPPDLAAPPKTAARLPSGVAVQRLRKGAGTRRPGPADLMTIHSSGWTRSGVLFESTLRGEPAVFRLADVVPGWRDALPRMVAGEKARLWVPAALAYGDKPRRPGFPAGDLVYEIELLVVK